MAKRRRKHRRNRSRAPKTPIWLVPAIVASGVLSIWLWKQANPGQSLNPMPA